MKESALETGIRLLIDSRLENVFLIGLAVRRYGEYLKFNRSEASNIELCVVEAVNNAIIHAYENRPGNIVDVAVSIEPDRIIIHVSHGGASLKEVPEPIFSIEHNHRNRLPESGMGLSIIRSVMDEVRYYTTNDLNVLTMEKRRP